MIGQRKLLLSRDPKKPTDSRRRVRLGHKYSILLGRLLFADDGHIAVLSIKFDKWSGQDAPMLGKPWSSLEVRLAQFICRACTTVRFIGLHFDLG